MEELNDDKKKLLAETEALLKRADAGKHSDFVLLQTWDARNAAIKFRDANLQVAESFSHTRDRLLREYIRSLDSQVEAFDLLASYKALESAVQFYIDEAKVADDALEEYRYYLLTGLNWVDMLLGLPRKEEDQWDHRYDKPAD